MRGGEAPTSRAARPLPRNGRENPGSGERAERASERRAERSGLPSPLPPLLIPLSLRARAPRDGPAGASPLHAAGCPTRLLVAPPHGSAHGGGACVCVCDGREVRRERKSRLGIGRGRRRAGALLSHTHTRPALSLSARRHARKVVSRRDVDGVRAGVDVAGARTGVVSRDGKDEAGPPAAARRCRPPPRPLSHLSPFHVTLFSQDPVHLVRDRPLRGCERGPGTTQGGV